MIFPSVTIAYASILALIFAALSVWVVAGRFQFGVLHGEGANQDFGRRMRAHANFAEYVPFILLLMAALEAQGASHPMLHGLLLPLTIARMAHPFGMLAPAASVQERVFRGLSVVVTLAVLITAALSLLLRLA